MGTRRSSQNQPNIIMTQKDITKNKRTLTAIAIASSIVLTGIISASVVRIDGQVGDMDKNYSGKKTETSDDAAANVDEEGVYYFQGFPIWRSGYGDSASLFLVKKEIDPEDKKILRVKYRIVDGQSNIVKIAELKCGLRKYREIGISDGRGKPIKENVTAWIYLINGTREWDVFDFSCNHTPAAL